MTDRLDAIAADLERPEVLNTENGCSVANVGSGDVRWLIEEVRRLRETQFCGYCGWQKAHSSWADLQAHIRECKQHPLRQAESALTALRERHAADVEAAFRAGYSAGGDDMSAAHHNEYYVGEDAAWLASEARRQLEEGR